MNYTKRNFKSKKNQLTKRKRIKYHSRNLKKKLRNNRTKKGEVKQQQLEEC